MIYLSTWDAIPYLHFNILALLAHDFSEWFTLLKWVQKATFLLPHHNYSTTLGAKHILKLAECVQRSSVACNIRNQRGPVWYAYCNSIHFWCCIPKDFGCKVIFFFTEWYESNQNLGLWRNLGWGCNDRAPIKFQGQDEKGCHCPTVCRRPLEPSKVGSQIRV